MAGRSSRQQRREPVRHPIPLGRLTAPPRRETPDLDDPRLPHFESGMAAALIRCPAEVVPLFAALAVVHQEMSGARPNSCLPVCYQIAAGLGHLGFDIEVMAAYAEVTRGGIRHANLGVRGPAVVRPDWTTNGHSVLWAAPFNRLVDPTVVQHPELLRLAHQDQQKGSAPLVIHLDGGRKQLLQGGVGVVRDPFFITYLAQPQHTAAFDPWFGEFREALDYGALGLAHTTLNLITAARELRDLRALTPRYPSLGALLTGDEQLPPLPADPPPSWVRLVGEAANRARTDQRDSVVRGEAAEAG
ncbi:MULTISPECIES: hypothetical protein [Micromonospora]|uniref:Uncharacterized protein n=1 Tax=Micromonospora sicca TaxID=2202420 RepID=A0A317D952_9ACTN|nr:hypothetical protein [Micromonospora sp. 4G51]PWR10196.1 hypothetical protein DKT69_29555 [Micromonospora sp. 4G51]